MLGTIVLRAQEELDKFLKNGRGKNIDPLDLLFFGGLTLLQMEILMLQVIGDSSFSYVWDPNLAACSTIVDPQKLCSR